MTKRTTQIFLPLDTINTMFALPTNKTPALLVSMDRDAYQHPEVRLTADLPDMLVSCTFSTIAAPNNRDMRSFYLTTPEAWAGAKGFAPQGTHRRIAMTKLVHTDTKVTPYVISEAPINLSAERWQERTMAAPSCPLPHERQINTGNISTRSIANTLERLAQWQNSASEIPAAVNISSLASLCAVFEALSNREKTEAAISRHTINGGSYLRLSARWGDSERPSDTPWKPSSVLALRKA